MNRKLFITGMMMLAMTMQAQTARKFTLNLTEDGAAQVGGRNERQQLIKGVGGGTAPGIDVEYVSV